MTASQASSGDLAERNDVLRAQIAIDMHPDADCAVLHNGRSGSVETHQLKLAEPVDIEECVTGCRTFFECGQCHVEILFSDESGEQRKYVKSDVDDCCICPVLADNDCLRRIEGTKSGKLIVGVTVPNREELRSVIADLREVGASVSIEWLVRGSEDSETAEIDISSITEKQREAMETAIRSGYYETPRKTDLGELADTLDISESAASQRLNNAETKLVKSVFEE